VNGEVYGSGAGLGMNVELIFGHGSEMTEGVSGRTGIGAGDGVVPKSGPSPHTRPPGVKVSGAVGKGGGSGSNTGGPRWVSSVSGSVDPLIGGSGFVFNPPGNVGTAGPQVGAPITFGVA